MATQKRFNGLSGDAYILALEAARQQLYGHLMQSMADIRNGDVCSMDDAIQEVFDELDTIAFEE